MKSLLLFLLLLSSFALYSQKIATSFDDAIKNRGITLEKLDDRYKSALGDDSTKAAFWGQEKEFIAGYTSLLNDLGRYLKKNNFSWGKTTRCFNRIYINSDGRIDYFLFNFAPGTIETLKETQFKKLVNEFIKTYNFPLKNKIAFAQCSPVKYSD